MTEPPSTEIVDRVVRLLITTQDRAAVARICRDKLGVAGGEVDAVIHAASEKLTQAAAVHRDQELGRAIARLHECYRRAIADDDTSTAIRAQRELNQLLGLGPASTGDEDESDAADPESRREIENQHLADVVGAIEHYLEPLGLSADVNDTDADLIRLAAEEIGNLRKPKRPRRPAGPKKPVRKRKAKS